MDETYARETKGWQENAHRIARGIRQRVLEHTLKNNGGYLSQACSAAEIFATLYTHVMQLGPSQAPLIPLPFQGVPGAQNPHPVRGADYNGVRGPNYDRFFLSPGHYALVVYATLIELGRLSPDGLAEFNQDGSTVEMIGADHSPGFEVMAGSLAQAISFAGGVAQVRMQEGQVWEALSALAHYHLDNVGIYVDVNGQQCDGPTPTVMTIEPLKSRLESFGALVAQVNGHDVDALAAPAEWLGRGKPVVVLAYTNPCQDMSVLEARRPSLHYLRYKSKQEWDEYNAVYQNMLATNYVEEGK